VYNLIDMSSFGVASSSEVYKILREKHRYFLHVMPALKHYPLHPNMHAKAALKFLSSATYRPTSVNLDMQNWMNCWEPLLHGRSLDAVSRKSLRLQADWGYSSGTFAEVVE